MAPTTPTFHEFFTLKETKDPLDLSKKADDLGVNYYTSFFVVSASRRDSSNLKLYFPVAEVYEKGSWRWLVIGGRPYKDEPRARLVLQRAQDVQYFFLTRMSRDKNDLMDMTIKFGGLTNPLDHWDYELES